MEYLLVVIVEVVLLAVLAIHIKNERQYQREIDEVHIMLMRINDELVQMTRSLK